MPITSNTAVLLESHSSHCNCWPGAKHCIELEAYGRLRLVPQSSVQEGKAYLTVVNWEPGLIRLGMDKTTGRWSIVSSPASWRSFGPMFPEVVHRAPIEKLTSAHLCACVHAMCFCVHACGLVCVCVHVCVCVCVWVISWQKVIHIHKLTHADVH